MIFTERNHLVVGLDPVADAFAGTVSSDVVSLKDYHHATFIVWWGVGATGTTLITVEACDDTTPTTTTAVAFRYRRYTSADTAAALTAAAAAGFTTTAGSAQRYVVEVDSDALAPTGYSYARLTCVEDVNSPILGGILIILSEPRYATTSPGTAVT
jgi:hypothetical protein